MPRTVSAQRIIWPRMSLVPRWRYSGLQGPFSDPGLMRWAEGEVDCGGSLWGRSQWTLVASRCGRYGVKTAGQAPLPPCSSSSFRWNRRLPHGPFFAVSLPECESEEAGQCGVSTPTFFSAPWSKLFPSLRFLFCLWGENGHAWKALALAASPSTLLRAGSARTVYQQLRNGSQCTGWL